MEKIREAQRAEEPCIEVLKNGLSASDRQKGFPLRNDLLRKFNRIVIPSNLNLKIIYSNSSTTKQVISVVIKLFT